MHPSYMYMQGPKTILLAHDPIPFITGLTYDHPWWPAVVATYSNWGARDAWSSAPQLLSDN